ncbi:MAG: alpha/beta hydrolase, partial [Gemmatimonadales bacterium]
MMQSGRRFCLVLTLLATAVSHVATGQTVTVSDSVVSFATRITLRSTVLQESRELDIWVPRSYADGTRRYPTLWVLDGNAYLLSAAGAVQAVANADRMPEVIVVAVRNGDRNRDFTPPLVRTSAPPDGMTAWGGAPRFLAFLRTEAVPAVEAAFRTEPFRALIGHSLGGLFVTWASTAAPDLFRASLVLDPSLWWDGRAVADSAIASIGARADRIHRLVTVENPGADGWRPDWSRLMGVRPDGVRAALIDLTGESHGSMFHQGVYRGLLALFADWVPEMRYDASRATVVALEEQYARLSRELGYQVPVPQSARDEV